MWLDRAGLNLYVQTSNLSAAKQSYLPFGDGMLASCMHGLLHHGCAKLLSRSATKRVLGERDTSKGLF